MEKDKNKTKNKEEENLKYNPEVTKHDKKVVLGDRREHIRGDEGDDSLLYDRPKPVDFAGEDLDIPGREMKSKHESTKLKSEENKHYSLGSEHNEELEQSDEPLD